MTVKLMMTGRRRVGQTLETHRQHLRETHGALVLGYIAADPEHAPRRYVQNHVLKGSGGRDFVTELWFPDVESIGASRQTDFYLEHLRPDEPNMVDEATVTAIVAREEPGLTGPALGFKVIFLHRAAPDLGRADFQAGWAGLSTPWPRSLSHVLSPGPFDGVDALRLPSLDAANDFVAGPGQDWLDLLAAEGLILKGGSDVLIAREYVLFEGAEAAPVKGTLP